MSSSQNPLPQDGLRVKIVKILLATKKKVLSHHIPSLRSSIRLVRKINILCFPFSNLQQSEKVIVIIMTIVVMIIVIVVVVVVV